MNIAPSLDELFEKRKSYPDFEARERLSRLVGLDNHISRLSKMIGLLINSTGLQSWVNKFHPDANALTELLLRRPPLVVLAGDVGSGKSELAETIGDMVARQEGIDISLLPLSLSSRGQGRVGEMTQLVSSAFDYTVAEAQKLKSNSGASRGGIILLIDEADALAQSRESSQMHHEDRAGVNAFIRGIDRIANAKLPAVVVMCTNRIGALDPAIKRRAADILTFSRPNEVQRAEILNGALSQLGFTREDIASLVKATGPNSTRKYGFTCSDLTQRLIPTIILNAYPHQAVTPHVALDVAGKVEPTPPFTESIC